MMYFEKKPHPSLKHLIHCFWIYEGNRVYTDEHLVIPDNCIDWLIDYSDYETPTIYICGMMTKPIYSTRAKIMGIRFQPGMAHQQISIPMDKIRDQTVLLDDLEHSDYFLDRAKSIPFGKENLDKLESLFFPELANLKTSPSLIEACLYQFRLKGYQVRIEDLCKDLQVSRQHLRRQFKKFVGISPKQFSQIQRIQAITSQMDANLPQIERALRHGFFDEAHFINTFKQYTGTTPREYYSRS